MVCDRRARRCKTARHRAPPTSPRSASPTSARPSSSGTRRTGKPIHNAIVWQDRRTAPLCAKLKRQGAEPKFTQKTGLLLDPYFSGTKIAWLLDNVKGARRRAETGELLAGTVDTFLIWRLTGGRVHATDATNASRTLVYDIATQPTGTTSFSSILRIPAVAAARGQGQRRRFWRRPKNRCSVRSIPILGVAGDQQAATIGQACFQPGMMKSTYGTGCFAVLNTGADIVRSKNRLLTTIAYRLDGRTTYALEGSIFIAGAAVQWLRDGLKVIEQAPTIAASSPPTADPIRRTSTSCRPSSASARRTGTPRRAARSSG